MEWLQQHRYIKGRGYFISTKYTPDHGYETMIFNAKTIPNGWSVSCWSERYQKIYRNELMALLNHILLSQMSDEEFLSELNDDPEEEETEEDEE